jgi:hypothetical protein
MRGKPGAAKGATAAAMPSVQLMLQFGLISRMRSFMPGILAPSVKGLQAMLDWR